MNAEDTIESQQFVFDDEPLEHILYGRGEGRASTANLYLTARLSLLKAYQALLEGRVQDAISAVSELIDSDTPISRRGFVELALFLCAAVPNVPNPKVDHDISPLQAIVEKMWLLSNEMGGTAAEKAIGMPAYRWYEHQGHFEQARTVIHRLAEIYQHEGDRVSEAVMINNLAFEYQLEGRMRQAMPLYAEAARIFREEQIVVEHANARANYWTCAFSLGEVDDVGEAEAELRGLADVLNGSGSWLERKPLVLLARIEERRGNIGNAIELAKRAIASGEHSGTRYPDLDREYLKTLLEKKDRSLPAHGPRPGETGNSL